MNKMKAKIREEKAYAVLECRSQFASNLLPSPNPSSSSFFFLLLQWSLAMEFL